MASQVEYHRGYKIKQSQDSPKRFWVTKEYGEVKVMQGDGFATIKGLLDKMLGPESPESKEPPQGENHGSGI